MSGWLIPKALHFIFMVCWFAGLFYLPRLFVHHAMSEQEPALNEKFKTMERKLYFFTLPWMILTLVFGLWMLAVGAWSAWGSMGWLQLKLVLVGVLVLYQLYCGKLVKDFKQDNNQHSHVWYRWFNEFPLLVLVAIVLLTTLKPF